MLTVDMPKSKPETETVPVTVNLPANIHRFLEKMADLQGLSSVSELLRYDALQQVSYYAGNDGGQNAVTTLAERLNIDIDILPDNVDEYMKLVRAENEPINLSKTEIAESAKKTEA